MCRFIDGDDGFRVLRVFVLTGFVIGAGGSVLAIRKFLQV